MKALFTQECLLRLRLPAISALETHVEAGTLVLPKLAKLASVLKDKYVRICQEGGTLPIEIDVRVPRHSPAAHTPLTISHASLALRSRFALRLLLARH